MVVVGKLGLFIISVTLHEKRFESSLIAIESFDLLFVDVDGSLHIIHLSAETFRLLNCQQNSIDLFELELDSIIDLMG